MALVVKNENGIIEYLGKCDSTPTNIKELYIPGREQETKGKMFTMRFDEWKLWEAQYMADGLIQQPKVSMKDDPTDDETDKKSNRELSKFLKTILSGYVGSEEAKLDTIYDAVMKDHETKILSVIPDIMDTRSYITRKIVGAMTSMGFTKIGRGKTATWKNV